MPAPGQYYPRRSGPHRIACIALYRSLLEQCLRIPLPADLPSRGPVHPLKHLLRKKFRQNAHHASPRLIVPLLKAGYAAEELIHAASTGNQLALGQIHEHLRSRHAQTLAARRACTQPPPKDIAAHRAGLRAYPGARPVVEIRPLPAEKISRVRYVPTLTVATFLPFLRFKKRQSPYLSRVLTRKVKQKQRRMTRADQLELEMEMGDAEGEWEDVVLREVEREKGVEGVTELIEQGWDDGGEWRDESERQRVLVLRSVDRERQRAEQLATKLIGIVAREKELWAKERVARRRASRARRKANQSVRKESEKGLST
ncbi:uncharacterized protein L3040_003413 [Drepanopeziza brunnea f. sp. 'multigermtubi']|uniref:uncharacterized protein n=1 Tax=Drepanopeziza brunnea f. sp. 'multigermtubi' TaxID=698441 RepID=UPI002399A937|nr:hypothetical protein L3040_003413 [Drepanopeziza brunnea f. sp. 'multigermtubi']